MEWFRFYNEAARDAKLKRLARELHISTAEVLGTWAIVLAFASESPERGRLLLADNVPITSDDIAELSGTCNVSETLQGFVTLRMLERDGDVWVVTNWDSRQFTSDLSTERVQKHRQKAQKPAKPVPVSPETDVKRFRNGDDETVVKRFRNGPDADTDTELTDTAAAGGATPRDEFIASGLVRFSNEIHMIPNQSMRDEIVDRLGDLFDRGITDWWETAIRRAIDANARRWAYVRSTIDRCMTNGRAPGIPPPQPSGRADGGSRVKGGKGNGSGFGIADSGNRSKQSRAPTQAELDEWERLEVQRLARAAAAAGRTDLPGV